MCWECASDRGRLRRGRRADCCFMAVGERQPLAVSALAVHGVMTGVLDWAQRYRLNRFDLLVPDGQPVRWALNLLHGARLPERVYGPTLMLKLCDWAAEQGAPIFLFGGTSDLLTALSAELRERFPKLQIAGARPSLFRRLSESERDRLVSWRSCRSGRRFDVCRTSCLRGRKCGFLRVSRSAIDAACRSRCGFFAFQCWAD